MCVVKNRPQFSSFFFFNDTATTEIYTLSLHDALPISTRISSPLNSDWANWLNESSTSSAADRKSTRLNSSHQIISYAVFCLKKKNTESNSLITNQNAPASSANPSVTASWPS